MGLSGVKCQIIQFLTDLWTSPFRTSWAFVYCWQTSQIANFFFFSKFLKYSSRIQMLFLLIFPVTCNWCMQIIVQTSLSFHTCNNMNNPEQQDWLSINKIVKNLRQRTIPERCNSCTHSCFYQSFHLKYQQTLSSIHFIIHPNVILLTFPLSEPFTNY